MFGSYFRTVSVILVSGVSLQFWQGVDKEGHLPARKAMLGVCTQSSLHADDEMPGGAAFSAFHHALLDSRRSTLVSRSVYIYIYIYTRTGQASVVDNYLHAVSIHRGSR